MHIILEGPDGGGKSTLASILSGTLGMGIHPRASKSESGPVSNLAGWVEDVDSTLQEGPYHVLPVQRRQFYMFDRHPLISEFIYSQSLGRAMPEMFQVPWWVKRYTQTLYNNAMVIFCLPSLTDVRENVSRPGNVQMPGVVDHISEIYQRYHRTWNDWGGPCIRYDYTRGAEYLDTFIHTMVKWSNR